MSSDETHASPDSAAPADEGELIRTTLEADFEILEELGRGGMAVVYRARERALDREVALKVLPLARTFDPELVERFQREARTAASLDHPSIVPIHRVERRARVTFFAMKLVPGPPLGDVLRSGEPMEPALVEQLLLEVGEALEHAHGAGVIHRDIKPDNILSDASGRFVVMDFGIAKSIGDTRITQTGGSLGTPRYMSPEQARGEVLDGRSDFYSLGVVAYHALVGRPPFDGDDPISILYAHVHDPVPDPELASGEARRVYAVIRRMLAKERDERLGSLGEIRDALRRKPDAPGDAAVADAISASSDVGGPLEPVANPLIGVRSEAGEQTDHVPPHRSPSPLDRLRGRMARTPRAVAAGVVATALAVFALSRDGAAARCRDALPEGRASDRAVLLDPPGSVARGAEIRLSYVACGMADREPFTASVTIRPADEGGVVGRVGRFFGGGDDPFRASWDEEADGFGTAREQVLSPGELEPGAYRLTVEIEDGGGRGARASHDFTVVGT